MSANKEIKKIESVKIALLGNSGVGKTSIINKYVTNEFKSDVESTIAANYQQKFLEKDGISLKLDLWDTAGQEKYHSISRYFYKNAYIIILVYDITDKKSFEDIKNIWYNDIKQFGEEYTVLGLVGNKNDLYEREDVEEDIVREYAEQINANFMLVSAQSGDNIDYLFETLVNKYLGREFQSNIVEKGQNLKIHKINNNVQNKNNCGC